MRLYNYKTRQLIQLLESDAGVVADLKISPDGKYIIVGTETGAIYVWSLPQRKLLYKVQENQNWIYKLDVHADYFVSSSYDGTVKVWQYGKHKSSKTASAHSSEVDCIVASKDGRFIASGGWDEKIVLYDKNLKVLQTLDHGTQPWTLSFSEDGNHLIAGTYNVKGGKDFCAWYSLNSQGRFELKSKYYEHSDVVIASTFIGSDWAVTAGGENNEVNIWKYDPSTESIKTKQMMRGVGHSKWSVGIEGDLLYYGNQNSGTYGKSGFTHTFNLVSHEINKAAMLGSSSSVKRIQHSLGDWKLSTFQAGEYHYNDGGLAIENSRTKERETVIFGRENGNRVRSYLITEDSLIIAGADNGYLMAFNTKGELIGYLFGHTGRVWGMCYDHTTGKLYTGSDDQTIKIWNLREFKQYNPKGIMALNRKDLAPIVSLFITEREDWILWSNDGYYTCSRNGGKYIGYHINKGLNKNADYYPFEQFDLKFNRPDLINKRLEIGSIEFNQMLYRAYQKRLKKMNNDEMALSEDIHIPLVQVANNSAITTEAEYVLHITTSDAKYSLDRLMVSVNQVPCFGTRGLKLSHRTGTALSKDISIPLSAGKNSIQVSVINEKGAESFISTLNVIYQKEQTLPDVYILLVGVSNYTDSKMNLKYAGKDAHDIGTLMNQGQTHYGNIRVFDLVNEKATKANVLAMKQELMKSKVDDIVMVFYTGHGVLSPSLDYYLATYDMDFANPAKKGLPYDEFESLLDSIPSRKKLLLMDACHSGELDKEEVALVQVETTSDEDIQFRAIDGVAVKQIGLENSFEMMKKLFADLRKGSGTTVIASAGGGEYAMEGEQWKNGVFTYCFLNGIRSGAADANKDGHITVSELQEYLQVNVQQLTAGKQKPTSRKENLVVDWVIW